MVQFNKSKFFLTLSLSLLFSFIYAQTPSEDSLKIEWLSWEEAVEKQEENEKKILLEVYTEWCTWCKKMDDRTFANASLVNYINKNYYAVKLDAQYKEPIEYNGKTYKYVKNKNRGYHELAGYLLMGRMSYPSVVFMDENLKTIQAIAGYKSADEFKVILTYFATNKYKSIPWEKYQNEYARK